MAELNSDHAIGRVHFPVDQLTQHDSEIVVQLDEQNGKMDVHLGFLQFHYNYQVKFVIKDKLGEDVTSDPLQNLNVRMLEAMPSEDGEGHELLFEFKAQKEKLMNEELVLSDSRDPSQQIKLVFHARVLGKGKGTPALRRGIHCIGMDVEEDSEQSDWQGFD